MSQIDWNDFQKVDIRVGTITEVHDFPKAKKPAFRLVVDFGQEIGTLKSSAQITDLYDRDSLPGKQVIAVINFPPRQIGPVMSQCLVTGFHDQNGAVVLAVPDAHVPDGTRLC
ncbi:export-related chaperone CsaA [Desulfonatronospira thiodismutans ASO3-1]|uniref:Export-related chaperone CsaA n=1 Tax=Desulfonatronospira thiodismutans ASO3-1 TaxID=555779 RepID=D6SMM6_9BACT|nr:tRNA-binding protein [Desulfonatronospira thiodismutans]EFI35937.1 export-related chaperone CsaA [Desulfonatronospira thiodismutans ASO3-1]